MLSTDPRPRLPLSWSSACSAPLVSAAFYIPSRTPAGRPLGLRRGGGPRRFARRSPAIEMSWPAGHTGGEARPRSTAARAALAGPGRHLGGRAGPRHGPRPRPVGDVRAAGQACMLTLRRRVPMTGRVVCPVAAFLIATAWIMPREASAISVRDYDRLTNHEQSSILNKLLDDIIVEVATVDPALAHRIHDHFYVKPKGERFARGLVHFEGALWAIEDLGREGKLDLNKVQIKSVLLDVIKRDLLLADKRQSPPGRTGSRSTSPSERSKRVLDIGLDLGR
jgi:hypothetical protein